MTTISLQIKVLIGSFQLVGGCLLIYSLFLRLLQIGFLSSIIIGVPILLLAFLSFYSGITLLKNNNNGINFSLLNFGLQLFQFSFSGLYYYIIIGPYVFIGYQKVANNAISLWTDYGFFTWTILLSITKENTETNFVTINLVTVIILVILFYLKGKEKRKIQ